MVPVNIGCYTTLGKHVSIAYVPLPSSECAARKEGKEVDAREGMKEKEVRGRKGWTKTARVER